MNDKFMSRKKKSNINDITEGTKQREVKCRVFSFGRDAYNISG